jgi:hypothetical protein
MRLTRTTSSVFAVAVVVALATFGSPENAAASPQASTWLHPGRGAHFAAAGNLAIALVRARETGPNRLEWSGRSPGPGATSRRAAARTAGAREPERQKSSEPPGSATNGSPGSRTDLLYGRGDDHRERKRLPEAWASPEPSRDGGSFGAGSRGMRPGLRLAAGEAVFHDAHAPPARGRSLVGRLS